MGMPTNGEAPKVIQPQPLPLQYLIGDGSMPDGTKMVVLQMLTPAGNQVYFLPIDAAKEFAQMVIDKAQELGSGIVIPRIVPPNLGG